MREYFAPFASIALAALTVLLLLPHPAAAQGYDTRALNETMPPGTQTDVLVVSPQPTPVDAASQEAALRASVARHLEANQALAGSNITVDGNRGTVVLDGTVAEARDTQVAESVARSVPGVINVVDQLRVASNTGTSSSSTAADAALARRVSQQLASSFDANHVEHTDTYGYVVPVDPTSNIGVQASNGRVTLSGIVPSYDALGRAISVSRAVPGVQSVETNLQVAGLGAPYSYPEDANVEHDVDGFGSGRFAKPMHRPYSRGDAKEGYRNPDESTGYGNVYDRDDNTGYGRYDEDLND